jgi:thymidylate synthase (FAD)
MKHQVGCAWNEISGRYVEFDYEFYTPSNFRVQSKDNKQGSEGAVDPITEKQAQEIYWDSCDSSMQAVMHFLKLREDSHAQWEIQEYARAVREVSQEHFPISLRL